MTDALISICIPTFNRAEMLDWLLERIAEQAAQLGRRDFTLVISDNASEDSTPEVVKRHAGGLPIESVRRDRNYGSYNNIRFAFGAAKTPYFVYCADDDLIDLARLFDAVALMEQDPALGATYYPIRLIEGPTGKSHGFFSPTSRPGRFKTQQLAQGLNFILDHHVFPEIAVFRREALERFPPKTRSAYWYFTLFANLLDGHDLAIGPSEQTFYTFFLDHPVAKRAPGQIGRVETSGDWDVYRGGLESILSTARAMQGLDDSVVAVFRAKIDQFVAQRQRTALDFNLEDGAYTFAYYLAKRLAVARPSLLQGRLLDAVRVGGAVEQAYNARYGETEAKAAVLVGDFPAHFNDLLKRFGRAWLASEAPGAARIGWNAQSAPDADAFAEPFMGQFRL